MELQQLKEQVDQIFGMESIVKTVDSSMVGYYCEAALYYKSPTSVTLLIIDLYKISKSSWKVSGWSELSRDLFRQLRNLHKK